MAATYHQSFTNDGHEPQRRTCSPLFQSVVDLGFGVALTAGLFGIGYLVDHRHTPEEHIQRAITRCGDRGTHDEASVRSCMAYQLPDMTEAQRDVARAEYYKARQKGNIIAPAPIT